MKKFWILAPEDIRFPMLLISRICMKGKPGHRVEPLVKDGRPFRVVNIENTPYDDKEFDFVYCSHVLEHVSEPARACEELMRIGKRGIHRNADANVRHHA